ncbi:MAG: transcriptional regulator [Candidatus Hydrothermarchaeota archaeon]
MRPPCEVVVKIILPSIRALVAKGLIEKYDMTQKRVSEKLGVTQPAISQYMSGKHAFWRELTENKEVMELINDFEHKLMSDEAEAFDMISLICDICMRIRSSEEFRNLYEEHLELHGCDICR